MLGITLLWPAVLYAQASQSVTFTLSVTIPEHAQLPASPAILPNETSAMIDLLHVQFQKDIRDHRTVYLASYVVD